VILRKASAHGLGHLRPPYTEDQDTPECPAPQVPLSEIGVHRWHHDLWVKIIEAALAGTPHKVSLDWHPALSLPAVSRYAATSPHMLKWMDTFNKGKGYRDRINPFGFMVTFQAKSGAMVDLDLSAITDPSQRGRPRKRIAPKPVAPFETDPAKAAENAFCRETGVAISPDQLLSYAEVLHTYHMSPEDKFENAEFMDTGPTKRRHVVAETISVIGKEGNQVGEAGEALSGDMNEKIAFQGCGLLRN